MAVVGIIDENGYRYNPLAIEYAERCVSAVLSGAASNRLPAQEKMLITHANKKPEIDPSSWVAPDATVRRPFSRDLKPRFPLVGLVQANRVSTRSLFKAYQPVPG